VAGPERIELPSAVLETAVLPLDDGPKIKPKSIAIPFRVSMEQGQKEKITRIDRCMILPGSRNLMTTEY
jgi:hypothetical protein